MRLGKNGFAVRPTIWIFFNNILLLNLVEKVTFETYVKNNQCWYIPLNTQCAQEMKRIRKIAYQRYGSKNKKKLHKNGNHITQRYAICSWINCAAVLLALSLSLAWCVCVCSLGRGCYLFIWFFLLSFRLLQRNAQGIISHRLLCARIVRSIKHEFMNKQIVTDGPTSIILMHRISPYFFGSFDASYDNYRCHHRLQFQSLFLFLFVVNHFYFISQTFFFSNYTQHAQKVCKCRLARKSITKKLIREYYRRKSNEPKMIFISMGCGSDENDNHSDCDGKSGPHCNRHFIFDCSRFFPIDTITNWIRQQKNMNNVDLRHIINSK